MPLPETVHQRAETEEEQEASVGNNESINGKGLCVPPNINSPEYVDARDEDADDTTETPVQDTQAFISKVSLYAKLIYSYARKENGLKGVKKYSRKLKRLSDQLQEGR